MNRAFLFVSVVLAVIAVIINQSYFDAPFPSDFKQGAYNLLLKAEEDIAEGNSETAIEKLKIAMMRANRCGRRGVFERIKTRFATSGRQIIEFDRQNALKMLCAYALFAADFNKTATQIESYVLNKTKGEITSFSYPLVYKNGSRTFWLESPKKAPIFLYRKLEPEAE
ncbi:MAG: hypothetical protein N2445_06660, partial [Acidobacteria bacterium]|nr:hypothetical protein [Acidobacteriota bacterium]